MIETGRGQVRRPVPGGWSRRGVASIGVALVVVALAAGSAMLGRPGSGTPSPSGTASEPPASWYREISRPGVSFEYPAAWAEDAAALSPTVPPSYRIRTIAHLTAGIQECVIGDVPGPTPTADASPGPPCWSADAGQRPSGSLSLWVSEKVRPLPGTWPGGKPGRVGGRDGWIRTDDAGTSWYMPSPDGGLYVFAASFPAVDATIRTAQVEALLDSVTFSAWQPGPSPMADGKVRFAVDEGVVIDYPAGWAIYYPEPWTDQAGNHSFQAIFASGPIGSCAISNEECPPHSLVLPGTAVAAIRSVSLSFGRPDWTTANTQVAGEPAIRTAWTGADEEDMALEVRLPGTFGILEIETAIRGPDRAALRTTLARWLAGVRIDLPHLPVGTTDVVAASAVKTALATLLSQNPGSDFYACFASGLGSHSALVASDQNALPLSRPHQATCTATVKRNSEFELWIVDLAATWADRRAGESRGLEDVLWINALGGVISVEHRSLSAPGSSPGM